MQNYTVRDDRGNQLTIQDIKLKYGGGKLCRHVGPYWFHAGPEKVTTSEDDRDRFEFISASVLCLVIDCILYRIILKGYKVLSQLKIPL